MKNILALKGGGIRGVYQARILQDLEQRTGKPIAKQFDLIASTSAGCINACALSLGIPARDIITLYRERGGLIFDFGGFGIGTLVAKHSAAGIESVLREAFGSATFSDSPVKLIGCIWNYTREQPKTVKSWADPEGWYMWEVARASSAAPTYFPPFEKGDEAFIDGGVASNDPSMWALAEARQLWPNEEVHLTTVGTGYRTDRRKAPWGGGILPWMPHIIETIMDGNQANVPYQCRALLGRHFTHIDTALPGYVAKRMDCASRGNINALVQLAEEHLQSLRLAG